MLLHELLNSRREEVLEACSAERHHPHGLDHLARYISEYFDDIVRLLKPGSHDLAPLGFAGPRAQIQIVGASPAMTRVRIGIEQLSHRSRTAVLLLGDVGTGRRHCALALHAATYPDGEFFEFDRSATPTALEGRIAALRGHVASAPGMTIYLPDIANTTPDVQRFLLDLLRLPLLPCRLIASSSACLSKSGRESSLRPDFAAAFASTLQLPPLSSRRADIVPLAVHFAEQLATRAGAPPLSFSAAAIDALQSYSWPGNVAELAALIGRLWRELGSGVVENAHLSDLAEKIKSIAFRLPTSGIVFAELEKAVITQALAMTENNKSRAAGLLGMTRDQLRYRMEKFDISGKNPQAPSAGKR